jgi:hypothetical protein
MPGLHIPTHSMRVALVIGLAGGCIPGAAPPPPDDSAQSGSTGTADNGLDMASAESGETPGTDPTSQGPDSSPNDGAASSDADLGEAGEASAVGDAAGDLDAVAPNTGTAESGQALDAMMDTGQTGDHEPDNPSGLVYYFPFNGDTKDHSGSGHDAINSGATLTTGHLNDVNGAYMFDGTSAFMTAPGADLPTGSDARTLTMWINPSTTARQYGIVSWGAGNCTGFMFGLGSEGDTFWGGCDDAGNGAGVSKSTWTFLAAVFTPPQSIKMFVNGTSQSYPLSAPLETHASTLWIGADTLTNAPTALLDHYAGAIDSIQIYNRALTDAEIAKVMLLP